MKYFVYILTNKYNGTLYIGVTNDLIKRIWQHKNKVVDGFTKKFDISRLVYFEECQSINEAIKREKQVKKWNRQWKINLIEKHNPLWDDLYEEIL